jgi:hypothetical protein
MVERFVYGITALPFLIGTLVSGNAMGGDVVTRFEDPAIVESSGLAVVDGLLVTTNDSGDSGRIFAVDPSNGQTAGVTSWSADPTDVEALAPAGGGEVWVGDIGDNLAKRDSVSVARVPIGRQDADVDVSSYELLYPAGPRDAESLLADPATGRLYVISKGVLGGAVYAAPERLSPRKPNQLQEIGPVLGIATDAAFFPDGRHIIVRNYSQAAVYSWPDLEEVGRFGLPQQEQGEGVAVAADGTIYVSSEGIRAPVLRISLPAAVRRAMRPQPTSTPSPDSASPSPSPSPSPTLPPGTRQGRELPEAAPEDRSAWGWALGGVLGLGIVIVVARALRPR